MKLNYAFEEYQIWTGVNSIIFERRLENETAFDGVVKIYSIRTNLESINQKLAGFFFGDFIFFTEKGVFLRRFKNKNSWPNSTLIYFDFASIGLVEVDTNCSSWLNWTGQILGNGKCLIEISPSEKIEFQT